MSGFVVEITDHVSDISKDAQLVGELLEHRRDDSRSRPNYFFLTDLTNPQQAYWDHIGEAPELTQRQRELFAHGNRMEAVARRAFSQVDGITGEEAVIDGAESDLPGIRGKIDFRYGESLVEFKTSQYQIDSGKDVWEKTPQNIEQLLFYAVLWINKVPDHHLVYHLGDGPNSVRAFTVTIENRGKVWNQLKSRKDNLEYAIESEKPSIPRKCRYYSDACHVGASGKCNCDELPELNVEPLQEASEINRDEDLEADLVKAFKEISKQAKSIKPWDLETPRQWFGRQVNKRERGAWSPDDLWVDDALVAADLLPGQFDDEFIPKIENPIEFSSSAVLIERSRTTNVGIQSRWVPTLYKSKDYQDPPSPQKLRNQIMQLGCACALAEKGVGNLIIELPNSDAEVVAYQVRFEGLDEIEAKIRDRLRTMNEAIEEEDPDQLPTCPEWLQEMDCENCLCK